MELSAVVLVLIGLVGVVLGGVLLARRHAVERWVIKRYERLGSMVGSGDGDEHQTETRWVPGHRSVTVLGFLWMVFGTVTVGIGIGIGIGIAA